MTSWEVLDGSGVVGSEVVVCLQLDRAGGVLLREEGHGSGVGELVGAVVGNMAGMVV